MTSVLHANPHEIARAVGVLVSLRLPRARIEFDDGADMAYVDVFLDRAMVVAVVTADEIGVGDGDDAAPFFGSPRWFKRAQLRLAVAEVARNIAGFGRHARAIPPTTEG